MFEPYTEKARRVIFFARFEAGRYGSPCIDTEHLLLGILREGTAIAMRLSRTPFTFEQIRKRIDELTPRGNAVSTSVDMPISEGSKRILGYAAEEAERLGDYYLGTNHLLLGMARESDGLAAKVLAEAGINLSEFRDEIARMSDASWKVAQPQIAKWEDSVEIHGELWSANSVRELAEYYRKFNWEKRQWVARDALLFRSSAGLFFYSGQPFDPAQAELLKGGWREDHCAICWWTLTDSDSLGHDRGYTNGQDWLCRECYERFVGPKRPAEWIKPQT